MTAARGEDIPIRLVDMNAGDLGRPEGGIVFDTRQAAAGLSDVERWSRALLQAKARCVESRDARHPVLSVQIIGPGKATMIREISKSVPKRVEVYTPPFAQEPMIFGIKNEDGTVSEGDVFYLFAR